MKTKEIIEKNMKWIALFICVVLVIGIVEDVLDKEIDKLDMAGYNLDLMGKKVLENSFGSGHILKNIVSIQ